VRAFAVGNADQPYATETGVWHNGLGMNQTLPTLASEFA